jgi:hypothetical protein|tara:strand:- start:294 stop:560 length:267 start_codon:yes stop_codon:yes gene_type:complete
MPLSGWGMWLRQHRHKLARMRRMIKFTILLMLLASAGCISEKLNGFQEIAERHPLGMEQITEHPESEALIIDLGRYINELERRIEGKR